MDILNFSFFFFLVVISLLVGFLYKCLAQIEDLKKQQHQEGQKDLDNDYSLTILKLNNELKRLEIEKRVHNNHLSTTSKKQEVIDQKNKSEFEKLTNVKNIQLLEIKQYQSLANQQGQQLQDFDTKQSKLVEEKDTLSAKLERQFSKSNQLNEQLLEKDETIQMLEKKLQSEQLAIFQLVSEHNQTLDRLKSR
ncbi:hypothetical protein DICPUDRAFT_74721 [Dictyostelium purpureum]|uniref:Uncharacterized protein n=1 Tax=Dictyostelium purpureum TaxID=5786 RepID=F0Z8J8_DICPU|nr:uncharacterized protein DICPUDRAFT_74721 [Dictyostelium purpureum]EGC39736.1 hypothetical protein DICPUDRAFT_74721 [Dictyostelium purpureum]|eukprot:XP_003283722.1 hypothetical protein DICPUDRAFT_74721 [Dictyostelium purpureum]